MCSLPPWKIPLVNSLSRSLQSHGLSSGFMQLATINATTGLPNCRTVVFRGFLSDKPGIDYATPTAEGIATPLLENPCGIIRVTSDIRSEKIRTLLHGRAIGELCWYSQRTK
ncbi:pyridoxamine 5'-phosphate oxidase [Syncephalis plumigaleata]|nr:pyridoxamine 5'-phosphate oxidase [Syncephalis plumigaleata]